jgi:hypothetical protein
MRAIVRLTLVLAMTLIIAWTVRQIFINHYGKPTLTQSQMRRLMNVLAGTQPKDLSAGSLDNLAASFNQPTCTVDGWGKRLLVTEAPGADPPYEIRSLGRDGRLGGCCAGFVDSRDEDAVLRGGTWLQGWR